MPTISQNLAFICQQIQRQANESRQAIPHLIAVSKYFPASAIKEAHLAGQIAFAENYVQELESKASELAALKLEWHFIGQIQSNKTRTIAKHASWVHSLTQLSHAVRLNQQRSSDATRLKVLLEVKINPDASKHGLISFKAVAELATAVSHLPRLELCGLMGVASNSNDQDLLKSQFKQLRDYLQLLNQQGFKLNQLSMGMSQDYLQAIECGATMLRIGSKIFGTRDYDVTQQ